MYKSIKFFIIFIFLIILGVLSLPLFVDEQKIVGLIEEKIQNELKLDIKFDKDVELRFFPYPAIEINNVLYIDRKEGFKSSFKKVNVSTNWKSIINLRPEIRSLDIFSPVIEFNKIKTVKKDKKLILAALDPKNNNFKSFLKKLNFLRIRNGLIYFERQKNFDVKNLNLTMKGSNLLSSKGSFELIKFNSKVLFDFKESSNNNYDFIIQQLINKANKIDYKGKANISPNNIIIDGIVNSELIHLEELYMISKQISSINQFKKLKYVDSGQNKNLIKFKFDINKLIYEKINLNLTRFNLISSNNQIKLNNFETFYENSKFSGNTIYFLNTKKIEGTLITKDFLIKEKYFGKSQIDLFGGSANCKVNFNTYLNSFNYENFVKKLNIQGECNTGEMFLSGIDLKKISDDVDKVSDITTLVNLINRKNLGQTSKFKKINLNFNVKRGFFNIESLKAFHPNLIINSDGKYNILKDDLSLKSKAYFKTHKYNDLPPLGVNLNGPLKNYKISYDFESLKQKLFNKGVNEILKEKKSIILDPKKIKKLFKKNIEKELNADKIIDFFIN